MDAIEAIKQQIGGSKYRPNFLATTRKVYLVDSEGRIWGTKTGRIPRKLKKAQKKLGIYKASVFGGIDFGYEGGKTVTRNWPQ